MLFVSEAATLAQVVRLAVLARLLPEWDVHFACARFDELIFGGLPCTRWPLWSLPAAQVERAVRWGLRPYSKATLRRYVAEDLRVIATVKPDVIVGDLRWSLAVSGPLSGVPVVGLANAYWLAQPAAEFPLPEHPIVKLLGVQLAGRGFPRALPGVFRWFAAPLDALRREHGLPPLGSLERVVTWGDVTVFADPPGFFPGVQGRFLGPLSWNPPMPEPPPAELYVTMGSSGSLAVLSAVMEAVDGAPTLLATAGRAVPASLPANVRAVPFVRGELAARRARVVICNGGASTAYQALAEGTPVVGLPANLDQYLAMQAIERAGGGVLVRSGTATAASVREAIAAARALDVSRPARLLREADPAAELQRALRMPSSASRADVGPGA